MTLTNITPEAKANTRGRCFAVILGGHKKNYNVDMFNGESDCMCEGLHGNFLVQLECFCHHAWIEYYMHGWTCVRMHVRMQEWRAEVFHSKPGARVTAACLRFIKTPGSPMGAKPTVFLQPPSHKRLSGQRTRPAEAKTELLWVDQAANKEDLSELGSLPRSPFLLPSRVLPDAVMKAVLGPTLHLRGR